MGNQDKLILGFHTYLLDRLDYSLLMVHITILDRRYNKANAKINGKRRQNWKHKKKRKCIDGYECTWLKHIKTCLLALYLPDICVSLSLVLTLALNHLEQNYRRQISILVLNSCAISNCSGEIPPCCSRSNVSRIRSATSSLPKTAPPRRTVSWNQYPMRYSRS